MKILIVDGAAEHEADGEMDLELEIITPQEHCLYIDNASAELRDRLIPFIRSFFLG